MSPYWLQTPAHDYLVVPITEFPDAIDAANASKIANGVAYLEEDDDARAFLEGHPEIVRADIPTASLFPRWGK